MLINYNLPIELCIAYLQQFKILRDKMNALSKILYYTNLYDFFFKSNNQSDRYTLSHNNFEILSL